MVMIRLAGDLRLAPQLASFQDESGLIIVKIWAVIYLSHLAGSDSRIPLIRGVFSRNSLAGEPSMLLPKIFIGGGHSV